MRIEPWTTCEHRGLTIKIYPDDDPLNPRKDYDNFGKMVCWHRRYNLGDEQPSCSPDEYLQSLLPDDVLADLESECEGRLENANTRDEERAAEQQFREAVQAEVDTRYLMLPVYLYDHSGLRMNTGGFSCPWDSGQVGFIYASNEQVQDEFGGDREKAEACLRSEVKVYDTYLSGGFTGYVVEDVEGNDLDSCWGFDDPDHCLQQAKSMADYYADQRDAEIADATADGGAEIGLEGV